MKKITYLTLILIASVLSACKKDNKKPDTEDKSSNFDLLRDSIYMYAQESYLWNKDLPSLEDFEPRSFKSTTEIGGLQKEVDALSQYAINPDTHLPYEYYKDSPGESKYSFVDEGGVSELLDGTAHNYGFEPIVSDDGNLHVAYVYEGTNASAAGLKRGDMILEVNNDSVYDMTGSELTQAFYYDESIKLKIQKTDHSTSVVTIAASTYTVNPVLADTVITRGSHKIGYLAFNSFTSPDNSDPQLNKVFSKFEDQHVTDLVVDLRYNGGGYVTTSYNLSNIIVPAAKNNTLMFSYNYNSNLQNDIYPLLKKKEIAIFKEPIKKGDFKLSNNRYGFFKKGNLNVKKVCFLVTGNTASASELLINNLLPQMDVQLFGSTTYGKPVGFFSIPVGKYDLYLIQFETKNSADKSNYYGGMTPGSADFPGHVADDDVTKDFGDPSEGLFANAVNYINTGAYLTAAVKPGRLSVNSVRVNSINSQFAKQKFRGMILNKIKR